MSQFATTASLRPALGEALDRRLRIGEGVEGDRVGQRWQHVGSGEIERERVGQQRCALEPQGGQRRGIVRADAVRAVVTHLDPHRSLAAREIDRPPEAPLERALQARRRRLDGDQRPHRVEGDRAEARHCLMTVGCSEWASDRRRA